MQFTIKAAVLKGAAEKAGKVLLSRSTLPILQNLHIEADAPSQTLTLTGNNLDFGVRVTLSGVSIRESGAVTLPGRQLRETCARLGDGEMRFTHKDGDKAVAVNCRNFNAKLPMMPAGEFIALDLSDREHRVSLPANQLADLLDCARAFAHTDATQHLLNSVHVCAAGGCLMLRATDKRVFCQQRAESLVDWPVGAGVTLPVKSVEVLVGLLSGVEGDVQLDFDCRLLMARAEGLVFQSKLIEGQYPDFTPVINGVMTAERGSFVPCDPLALRQTLSVAEIACGDFPQIALAGTDEGLRFSASSAKRGSSADLAALPGIEGEMTMNPNYLRKLLEHAPSGAEISLPTDGKSALIVRTADESLLLLGAHMNKS